MNKDSVWELVVAIMGDDVYITTFIYENESTAKKTFYSFIDGKHADYYCDIRGYDVLTYNDQSMRIKLANRLIG